MKALWFIAPRVLALGVLWWFVLRGFSCAPATPPGRPVPDRQTETWDMSQKLTIPEDGNPYRSVGPWDPPRRSSYRRPY